MQAKSVRELGAVLRERRIARGQTQRGLADEINVTQSAISKVEKGYPGASIGLIFQMLKALDLPLTLGGEAPPSPPPPQRKAEDDFVDLDAIANTGLKRK
ncbi:MAG: helix-turn-helix transcriptional regulator [Hyphomonadaceae bacterium]|nr:helix-turn-helix transcriptional regulator [Hyphomonadaceae bacterium]